MSVGDTSCHKMEVAFVGEHNSNVITGMLRITITALGVVGRLWDNVSIRRNILVLKPTMDLLLRRK